MPQIGEEEVAEMLVESTIVQLEDGHGRTRAEAIAWKNPPPFADVWLVPTERFK